jgi:universal stress protein E
MHPFRNILVGVDPSRGGRAGGPELNPPTQEAVRQAVRLASRIGSAVTFFAVLDTGGWTRELLRDRYEQATEAAAEQASRVLEGLVVEAKRQGVQAEARIEFGRPWEEIIRKTERDRHDVVVVGTRDRGAASRLLFGSTALRLLRNAPCPVWITRPDPDPEDVNMLVASDLSKTSLHALHLAVDCGRLLDAKVHLLHAVEFAHQASMLHTGVSDEELHAFRRRIRDDAEQALREQLVQTDYRTLPYGVRLHVLDGPADIVILQAIEEHGIDLLVLGTVGRSGLPGLLLGNTAERLLAQVPCSVLAVKPEQSDE